MKSIIFFKYWLSEKMCTFAHDLVIVNVWKLQR